MYEAFNVALYEAFKGTARGERGIKGAERVKSLVRDAQSRFDVLSWF